MIDRSDKLYTRIDHPNWRRQIKPTDNKFMLYFFFSFLLCLAFILIVIAYKINTSNHSKRAD